MITIFEGGLRGGTHTTGNHSKNSQSSRKSLKWTDLGANLVAEFNANVCSPCMFDVSPSFELETEGRVPEEGRLPDGVVSPSSGPDMQGLLRHSASFGWLSTVGSLIRLCNKLISIL